MAGQKTSISSHKNIVLWLLGFTICYQIVYQAFMHHELREEALDEECRAPPGGAAFAGGQSPQCAEVQLFRSWQETEEEWHAALVAETGEEHLIKDSVPVKHFGEMTEEAHSLPAQLSADGMAKGNATSNATSNSTSSAASNASEVLPHSRDSMHGAIAAIAEATAAATAAAAARTTTVNPTAGASVFLAPVNVTDHAVSGSSNTSEEMHVVHLSAWAEGLEKMQHRLEEQMEHLPSMQHKHAHEHQARMDALMDSVAASLANASTNNAMTPWAAQLVDLQKHLDSELHAREAAHHHHHHEHHAVSTTTEVPLLERIYRVGHELCATPDHRDRPECAQFMEEQHDKAGESDAQRLAHRAAKASWRMNLSEEIREREERLDRKLAELRDERKAWEDAFIARVSRDRASREGLEPGAGPAEAGRAASALRGGGRTYVHWSAVKAWHGPKWWERSDGPALLKKEEVQGAHWGGMIPKVACVTAITSGFHAKIQIKYFINNFHLQSYEGPRQLVFVYHHTDKEAARLVQMYSDGVSIRGVAARNDEAFPSTMGLRYGAWITDADVIARWDFEEWHHPNRLSLQVRALALSTRPACLIEPHAGGHMGNLTREASLVGEAVWMRRHWRPLAANESEILDSVQASRVVHLRADDLRHEGHGSSTRRRPSACEGAPGAEILAEASDPGLEERIGVKVGPQMQEKYRGLASKRRDAAQKLRSLCVEHGAEPDAQRRERLSSDAEKMAAILGELDKHFAALGSLFGGAA